MTDAPTRLADLPTPALLLDRAALERNCARMAAIAERHGVNLRPHLKTAKSAEVARLATRGRAAALTVSTVAEVAYFAANGFVDLTYAVGITPEKIAPLAAIQAETGARIRLIADDAEAISRAGAEAGRLGATFELLIEVDTGDGRGGVDPNGDDLLALAACAAETPALTLAGVLTHAGHSYDQSSLEAIRAVAEDERAGAVAAAERLRAAGIACPVVSVGSTPTALMAERLDAVTEIRPGVYTLFDLKQAALGVCTIEDIAVSVLATVIGHNPRSGRVLIDAGALALSKDVSASKARPDVGYGLVCPPAVGAAPYPGLYVDGVCQEHGLIAGPGGSPANFERLPIGAKVRVLPNHACMMAAPWPAYRVVEDGDVVAASWGKTGGWY